MSVIVTFEPSDSLTSLVQDIRLIAKIAPNSSNFFILLNNIKL